MDYSPWLSKSRIPLSDFHFQDLDLELFKFIFTGQCA